MNVLEILNFFLQPFHRDVWVYAKFLKQSEHTNRLTIGGALRKVRQWRDGWIVKVYTRRYQGNEYIESRYGD